MAEDEPDIIIDRDGNVRPGPGADEDTARGIKEIDMDDIEDDSDGGGGSGGGSSSRSAEDFDPDDYPFAKSVEELGEIRREEYGLTNQEKRRVERGEDPVPDGGEGFAVYDPEFDGGSGEVIGTGDTEEEAATAAVRTRVSQAREQRGTTRFNQGLPFDVTDDQVEEQQVRELENREQTLRQREQDIQETINRLPDAERLNIEGTSLEGEFDSNVVSRDQLKTYFQDQQTQLRDTREQVSNQRENVRFELSQVQRPERTQIDTFDPSPDPAEPQTGLSGRAVETADRFRNTLGTDPDPGEPMTGFFSTDTAFGYQGPAIRGPGESNTIETGVENPSGTSIQGTSFLDQQGIRSEEALNDFTDPFGERIRDRLNLEDDRTAKDTPEDVEVDLSESGLGTRIFVGATGAFNPNIDSALVGAGIDDALPTGLPFIDRTQSGQQIAEEEIERQIEEGESITENISPLSEGATALAGAPIGRAAGAGLQGLRSGLGETAGRIGTATLTGTGLGLGAAEAQQISRLEEQGRDEEAAGRAIGLSADLAGATVGAASGIRDFAPRIGRTTELDSTSFGTFVDEDNLIGTGTAEGQARIIRDRFILPGQSNRPLQVDAEFRFDADEAGTIAEGTTQFTGRNIDETVDFETVSNPVLQEDDLTVTNDLTRTETEGPLFRDFEDFEGTTRQRLEEVEEIDTLQRQTEEGFIETPEQLERRQFGVSSRIDDGTEVFGESELFLPQRDRGTGTGGGTTQSFDGGLTAPNIERGVLRGIQEANPNLGGIEGGTTGGALAASEVSTGLEEVEGGSTASGVQGEMDAIEAFEQQERQLQQQEEMAIQGSPLEQTESFTREPVSDRLLREPEGTQQITEAEETQTFDTASTQDTQLNTRDPLDTGLGEGGPPTGLEEVTDPGATLTRGTTLFEPRSQSEEPRTGLFETQTASTQQEQRPGQRPLEEGVMGLTRGQVPEFREETGLFRAQRQGSALGLEESQAQRQQAQQTPTTGLFGRPSTPQGGAGLPDPGFGGELETGVFGSDPGAPSEGEFTPDLTGSLFGGGVSSGPVTGLERRSPEEEEEPFDNPGIL